MRKGHFCLLLSQFLKYISIVIPFEPDKIFFKNKKEILTWITPYTRANEGFLVEKIKTIVESMIKRMLRKKVQ
jgi:hypothetical protein